MKYKWREAVAIAQLIKLQNYVSRYEWDLNRYAKQFMKVKNEQWNKLYEKWDVELANTSESNQSKTEENGPLPSPSLFTKWLNKLRMTRQEIQVKQEAEKIEKHTLPRSEIDLKYYFLEQLYPFQLKWATSTLMEKSFIAERYLEDQVLKGLLMRFPDNIFVMYDPIFEIKQAPVETDIIFITPIGIEVVHFIDAKHPEAVISAGDERTWTIDTRGEQEKILSPVISVKRTENLINSILQQHQIKFDVSKTILSPDHQIIRYIDPYKTNIIDNMNFKEWFQPRHNLSSPLKSIQMKSAEAILNYTMTVAVKRPEWEDDTSSFPTLGSNDGSGL